MKPWYLLSETVAGIPVTRYVASWYLAGGRRDYVSVKKWLASLDINGHKLTDDEIKAIAECIDNGSFELQETAKNFIK